MSAIISAADSLASWASQEGFCDWAPSTLINNDDFINVSDTGKQIFRQKLIQQIGINELTGEIFVYLKKTVPNKKQIEHLPQSVREFAIKYIQGAEQTIGGNTAQPQGGPPWRLRQINHGLVYTCGSSISVGNFTDAGTLGALVKDAAGNIYGLSNNHVSGSCNHADINLPILAPGVVDVMAGGLDPFTIGFHAKTLPMTPGSPTMINVSDNHDAAIFKIKDPNLVSSYQGDAYDTPPKFTAMLPNMLVEKVGRTTNRTNGVVQCQIHGPMPIAYNAANYGFSGRVFYEPAFYIEGIGDLFSDNGDSGSLIVTTDENGNKLAVGLVVGSALSASAPGGKLTIALPIDTVLNKMNLSLVNGHNI